MFSNEKSVLIRENDILKQKLESLTEQTRLIRFEVDQVRNQIVTESNIDHDRHNSIEQELISLRQSIINTQNYHENNATALSTLINQIKTDCDFNSTKQQNELHLLNEQTHNLEKGLRLTLENLKIGTRSNQLPDDAPSSTPDSNRKNREILDALRRISHEIKMEKSHRILLHNQIDDFKRQIGPRIQRILT